MSFAVPFDPSVILGAGLLAAGFSATMVGTMLGAGGGLIAIPILHMVFMQVGLSSNDAMIMTAGTSALAVVLGAPRVLLLYMRRGFMDWDLARKLVGPLIVGTMAAHAFGLTGSAELMKIVFAVVVFSIAAYMAFGNERHYITKTRPDWRVLTPFGVALGVVAPLIGISGAVVAVPFLIACRIPLRKAIGTSAVVALTVGIMSFVGYVQMPLAAGSQLSYTIGSVHILAAIIFCAASYVGAPVGLWLQQKLPTNTLKNLFAGILFLSGLRFLWLVIA